MTGNETHFDGWVRPNGAGGVRIGQGNVPAGRLEEFVGLLYEIAGRPPCIVLPRFSVHKIGENGPGWMVRASHAGRIHVRVDRDLPVDEALTLACTVAAYTELAEDTSEPDPDKVERLAAFLDESMDTAPEDLARNLLAHFDLKERAA